MPQSNILMYTTEDGGTKIEVTFDHDTVWLSIDQMAELFQRDKSVIGKHVRNIFISFCKVNMFLIHIFYNKSRIFGISGSCFLFEIL